MTGLFNQLRYLEPPLWILAVLACITLLLQLAGSAPPWPKGVGWITPIFCIAAAMAVARLSNAHATWRARRMITVMLLLMVFGFVAYLILMSRFTFTIPTTGEVGVKGFVCTPEALAVYSENCPADDREALGSAEFESARIWRQWTIDVIRIAMVSAWFAGFAGLAWMGAVLSPSSFGTLLAKAPEPYEGEESFFFMSYAHQDLIRILPVIDRLSRYGVRLWYDKGIPGAQSWDTTLSTQLRKCRGVIAFVSRASLQSKWVTREIMFADDLDKPLFCTRLEPCELKPPLDMVLARTQVIDGSAEHVVYEFLRAFSIAPSHTQSSYERS